MGLKDILVHVDTSQRSSARVAAAVNLAVAHHAHLIGLYVITQLHIPNYIRAEIGEDLLRNQEALVRAAAKKAESEFLETTARAGIQAEWRCVEGDPISMICLHGRYVDVVVAAQRDPEGEEGPAESAMPDRVILSVGRPALIIPHVGDYPVIGRRIMVAWDGSRLATRAVNDALPFLVEAKSVIVLAVNPEGGEEGHGEIPSADICLHLARHGVKAEAQHVYADDISTGDMILSRAAEQGVDLLVLGAYGHARLRELVMGGVTRYLLRHMTIPCLMSH
jgi:nucleotide-binding universal stress UspA family protein